MPRKKKKWTCTSFKLSDPYIRMKYFYKDHIIVALTCISYMTSLVFYEDKLYVNNIAAYSLFINFVLI